MGNYYVLKTRLPAIEARFEVEGASTMDLLGENGRRAINASVKVSVCKKTEPWKCYSKNEAKCLVQGCYLGDVDQDVDWNQVFEANFYDICDIQEILTLLAFGSSRSNGRKCDEKELETVMNRREKIKAEYIECAENMEMVEHGTGTVIQKHFVVTCRHVVETVLFDNRNEHVIFISNEQTDNKLFCKVIYDDTAKDLALLHCPKLNSSKICPLKLSHKIQKVGFQFFCFGYPINHHGIKALCVDGMISGSNQERYGRPELMVLCSSGLNHGFSGGPVLLKYDCEMVMIGIVKEKQIERMLTIEDEEFLGQVYTQGIAENIDDLTARKIQERLEQIDHKLNEGARNYPSGLSNAITGATVQEFLNEAAGTYKGWDCGELKELTVNMQSASFTTC